MNNPAERMSQFMAALSARSEVMRELARQRASGDQPGLGDRVASALDAVGITKERVQAVASRVGVEDCGCKQRQQALNRLGERLGMPPGKA